MTRSLRAVALAGVLGLAAPLLVTATAVAAPTTSVSAASTSAASAPAKHITIPANYVYNPNAKRARSLHDYCTKSPDAYRPVGKDADFRGPCARHDMCIQYRQVKRSTCDSRLLADMKSECRWTYKHSWDPRRGVCLSTAYTYWLVVRAKTAIS